MNEPLQTIQVGETEFDLGRTKRYEVAQVLESQLYRAGYTLVGDPLGITGRDEALRIGDAAEAEEILKILQAMNEDGRFVILNQEEKEVLVDRVNIHDLRDDTHLPDGWSKRKNGELRYENEIINWQDGDTNKTIFFWIADPRTVGMFQVTTEPITISVGDLKHQ